MSPFRCPFRPWLGFGVLAIAFASTAFPVASLAGDSDCIDYGGSFMHRVGQWHAFGEQWVAMAGHVAYVANEERIQVVDVSNPAAPVTKGSLPLMMGSATGIAVSGEYAYLIEENIMGDPKSLLSVFSLDNPLLPALMGQVAFTGWPSRSMAVSGNLVFVLSLIGNGSYLKVIDVTNPHVPALVGELSLPYYARKIAASGTHVYVTREDLGGMQIIDISNPSSPSPVPGGIVETSDGTYGIAADGQHVYLASGPVEALTSGKLRVIDVSDPGQPMEVASVSTMSKAIAVIIHDQVAFVTDWTRLLYAIDVSDPETPVTTGMVTTNFDSYSLAAQGTTLLAAMPLSGLDIFDVSNTTTPVPLTTEIPGGPTDIALAGNVACITTQNAGLQIVQVVDPNPILVGALELPRFARAVAAKGNHAFVCTAFGLLSTLHVIDIHDPASPIELGATTFGGGSDVAAAGSHVFVAGVGGLLVFDVANPSLPTMVAMVNTPANATSIAVSQDYAYVGCQHVSPFRAELAVFDVSAPDSPILVGSATMSSPSHVADVAVAGANAYVVPGNLGLCIFDVSSPDQPQLIREVAVESFVQSVAISHNQSAAYVIEEDRLSAIDISSPEHAALIGDTSLPYSRLGTNAAMYGETVLVTCTFSKDNYPELTTGVLLRFPGQCPAVTGQPDVLPHPALAGNVLKAVHPNPFTGTTAIAIELAASEAVALTVHDIMGRHVRTLVNGQLGAGKHAKLWDGRTASGDALANGVYYLRLMHSGGGVESRAVTILR